MGPQRFQNLDAMRGVCALTVVLLHCEGLFASGTVFCHGYLAVDVFFVLSGFVIGHTYEKRLAAGLGFGAFTWRRLKRLTPVYWVGTVLGGAMLAIVAAYRPAGTFYSADLIVPLWLMAMVLVPQVTLGGMAYPANGVAWSLLGELVVNLLYARWLQERSTRVLVVLVVLGWSVCAVYGYLNPYGWCFGERGSDVIMTPFRAVPGFLMGVVLYRAHVRGALERLPAITPIILLILWILIAEVPTHRSTPTFDLIVATLASPLLIALLVRATVVAPKPFLWLGAISYPLYASHLALIFLARYTPLLGFQHGPDPVKATLLVGATIVLAWVIHRFIEQRPALPVRAALAA